MLIPHDTLEGIAAGTVTLAFRRWLRPRVLAGTRLRTAIGLVQIDAIEVIDPAAITDAEARAAGSPDAETLLGWLRTRDGECYRIRLHHAGDDPRIALRERDDLSQDEVAELWAILARADQSSRTGPWTARVLDVIDRRPGDLAADLAAELAVETLWLKRQVRRLKELGLTESLPRGYRLAPRGRAYRAHSQAMPSPSPSIEGS